MIVEAGSSASQKSFRKCKIKIKQGTLSINVDGAPSQEDNGAGFGIIIRNSKGCLVPFKKKKSCPV